MLTVPSRLSGLEIDNQRALNVDVSCLKPASVRPKFSPVFFREHVRIEVGDPLLAFLRTRRCRSASPI